jgi:hypothetical protein
MHCPHTAHCPTRSYGIVCCNGNPGKAAAILARQQQEQVRVFSARVSSRQAAAETKQTSAGCDSTALHHPVVSLHAARCIV